LTEDQRRRLERQWLAWRLVLRYGIGVVVFVFFTTASFHFRYTPDETYVYLQHGRSIARGDGFASNAGVPVGSAASPLWTFLIAGGTSFGLDPYIVAKTLDLVCASFAVIAVLAFAFVLLRDRVYALFAAGIFSFDVTFLRWTGTGLEVSLAVFLVLMTLWYGYKKEYITAALVAGLLTLAWPAGVLLFIALVVDCLINRRVGTSMTKVIVASVLLYSFIVGSWVVYALFNFGAITLQSLSDAVPRAELHASWFENLFLGVKTIATSQPVPALLLLAGLLALVRLPKLSVLREDGFPLLFLLLVLLCCLVMNIPMDSRHLAPLLPVVVVYGLWGIKRLEIGSFLSSRRALNILFISTALSLAQNQYIYRQWVVPHMESYVRGMDECLKPIAFWARTNTPESCRVFSPVCGMIGYISGRTMVQAEAAMNLADQDRVRHLVADTSLRNADVFIDRSSVSERLKSDHLVPVMTKQCSGFTRSNPSPEYFTLYKVVK